LTAFQRVQGASGRPARTTRISCAPIGRRGERPQLLRIMLAASFALCGCTLDAHAHDDGSVAIPSHQALQAPSSSAQSDKATTLPPVTVVEEPVKKPQPAKHTKGLAPAAPTNAPAPAPAPMFQWTTTDPGTEPGANAQQRALDLKMQGMDQSRESLLTKIGATSYSFSREAIEALPQGDNTENRRRSWGGRVFRSSGG